MNAIAVTIRPEESEDHERVHAVVAAAFGGEAEAVLIRRLRGNVAPEISLVALDAEQRIVGHVYFSPVRVGASGRHAIALGPVSVDPAYQQRAVGSALCRRGLEECAALGESVVFVLGHATYYPRFGFELARPHALYYKDETFASVFFVAELTPGALAGLEGEVCYRSEFNEM